MAKTTPELEVREVKNKFDWNDTANAAAASALAGLTAPWLVAPFNAVDSSANAKIFEHMPKNAPISAYYKEMARNPEILKATYKAVPAKLAKNVPAQVATLGSFSLFKNMMNYVNPKTDTKIQTRIKKEASVENKFKEEHRNIPMAKVLPKIEEMVMNRPSLTHARKRTWGGTREAQMAKEASAFGALKTGVKAVKSLKDFLKTEVTGRNMKWANRGKSTKNFAKGFTGWMDGKGKQTPLTDRSYLKGIGTMIAGHTAFSMGASGKTNTLKSINSSVKNTKPKFNLGGLNSTGKFTQTKF